MELPSNELQVEILSMQPDTELHYVICNVNTTVLGPSNHENVDKIALNQGIVP